jgi:hypothetical protein
MKYLYVLLLVVVSTMLVTDRVRLCQRYNKALCGGKCTCCSVRLCNSEFRKCHCDPCQDAKVDNTVQSIMQGFMTKPPGRTGISASL